MPNIKYIYTEEIKELRSLADYAIRIQVIKTELLPDGNLEITYGLTANARLELDHLKSRKGK